MNRFKRWRKAGHWAGILQAVSEAYHGDIQMIDIKPVVRHWSENRWRGSIRVHHHGANGRKKGGDPSSGKMIPRIILFSCGPWVARAAA